MASVPSNKSSKNDTAPHSKARIGTQQNFWIHHSAHGFDLTRPSTSRSDEDHNITIETETTPITLSAQKSALVIIDMQNFFLHPGFGRQREGAGQKACNRLMQHAIPAARQAKMQVIWLNWGLTEEELREMPPGVKRAFGFQSIPADEFDRGEDRGTPTASATTAHGKDGTVYKGLGADCGAVEIGNGEKVDGGRLLMRDTWNAALFPPLDQAYRQGLKLSRKPDIWCHKNRMSGMWGARTELEDFLEKEGICTLLFAGVNTDQCVGGTLTDAFSKGYDCILLGDGCGTTSPNFAQQCFEFNAFKTYGFCTSCEEFVKGVHDIQIQNT